MAEAGDSAGHSRESIEEAAALANAKIARIIGDDPEKPKYIAPEKMREISEVVGEVFRQFKMSFADCSLPQPILDNPIQSDHFITQAKTGDLLLVESSDKNIELVGPVSHVGVLIRGTFAGADGNTYGNPDSAGLSILQVGSLINPLEWINDEVKEAVGDGIVVAGPIDVPTLQNTAPRRCVYVDVNVRDPAEVDQKVKEFAGQVIHGGFNTGPFPRLGLSVLNHLMVVLKKTDLDEGLFTAASLVARALDAAGILHATESLPKSWLASSFLPSMSEHRLFNEKYPHIGRFGVANAGRVIEVAAGGDRGPPVGCLGFLFGRAYRPVPTEMSMNARCVWMEQSKQEYLSVASLSNFAMNLVQIGAPNSFVSDAFKFAGEELRHAQICKFMSELAGRGEKTNVLSSSELAEMFARYNLQGQCIDAHTLNVKSETGFDHMKFVDEVVVDGCIAEAVSTCISFCQFEAFEGPEFAKEKLLSIAEDEIRHCQLSWKVIIWALDNLNGVQRLQQVSWWKEAFKARCADSECCAEIFSSQPINVIQRVCWAEVIEPQVEKVLEGTFSEEFLAESFRIAWKTLQK